MDDYIDLMSMRGPKNAYGLFCESIEKADEKNNVEITFNEQHRKCSDKWKSMSKKEKRPFQILAGEDYYLTEIYKKNGKKVLYGPFPPMPDFYWFCQDEKPKIESEKPDATVAEIVEELKKRWKESSSEKKKEYEKIAKEDKERFENELEEAESEEDTENEDFESEEDTENENCELEDVTANEDIKTDKHFEKKETNEFEENCVKFKKTDYDSKIPKGRISTYAFFVESIRKEEEKNKPNSEINFSEFSKKCSEKWKLMSDEEKNQYQILAENDKEKYDNQVKESKKKSTFLRDPNVPKRALSDFFWFCNEERPKVRVEHPDATVVEVAKELGKRWLNCPAEKKEKYELIAKKDKERYEKELELYNKSK